MTFLQQVRAARKDFFNRHGRWPSRLVLPLSREFDINPSEVGPTLWEAIWSRGASVVLNRTIYGTPVRWECVDEILTE